VRLLHPVFIVNLENRVQLGGNIAEVDGLRGIASLLVLLHHFWPSNAGIFHKLVEVAHLGWIGVDLFFVISGFLITGILLDSKGQANYYSAFYARRALRIFPLYYLFLLMLFVVIPFVQKGAYLATAFIHQSGNPLWYFLYLGNVREAITGREPGYFLAPLWSLSIEEQFYLTFPLVVSALSRRRLRTLLYGLVIAAPFFRLVTALLIPGNERIQYLATPSRVDVISLGALLALELRSGGLLAARRNASTCLLVMTTVLAIAFSFGGLNRMHLFCRVAGYSLVALTFASLLLWTLVHRDRLSTAFLRFPPLMRVGKWCYGVYLLQRPAEMIFLKCLSYFRVEIGAAPFLFMMGEMLSVFIIAGCSWYLFESRILKLKKYFVAFDSRRRIIPAGAPVLAER
jgi:peptidoglycan/LPS O-acetylase OafA/YrhL